MPQDGDRDPWADDASRDIARSAPRVTAGVYGASPEDPVLGRAGDDVSAAADDEPAEHEEREIPEVPVRRQLSVAIAGFAALLGAGLILGAQTAGPDARLPYAVVVFGVQLLYVLAWTMAMRPPARLLLAGTALVAGLAAAWLGVTSDRPSLFLMLLTAPAGIAVVLVGQLVAKVERQRVRDALGSTVLIVLGPVLLATLIALTRKPTGTQAVLVCLAAVSVALVVARLTDAVFPKPRIAPQVARGAAGIIVGAMLGTLAATALGSVLVLPFTPAKGAILGLIAAGAAVLVDLAINFSEAGREVADEAPTLWVARHMQGPLGAFALASFLAYVLTVFVLS
jgi:hypothetical protein